LHQCNPDAPLIMVYNNQTTSSLCRPQAPMYVNKRIAEMASELTNEALAPQAGAATSLSSETNQEIVRSVRETLASFEVRAARQGRGGGQCASCWQTHCMLWTRMLFWGWAGLLQTTPIVQLLQGPAALYTCICIHVC
jgi:hypothetical protein